VRIGDAFRFDLRPWPGKSTDYAKPELDTSRFDVPIWQKLDRLIAHAHSRGVVVSTIFHLDGQDPGVDPFGSGKPYPLGDAEKNYYRYAAARPSAHSNIMWEVTNDWHLFRDETWVKAAATTLRNAAVHQRPMSVHCKGVFPFRTEPRGRFRTLPAMGRNRRLRLRGQEPRRTTETDATDPAN
jgi:hypothetical protein